jgi:hypothetical protein
VTPRYLTALAVASALALGACNDDSSTNPKTQTAQVRFINAMSGTNTLTVNQNGTAVTGASNLAVGANTAGCTSVNVANHGLTFQSGTTTLSATGFTPNFQNNGKYLVFVTGTPSAPVYFTVRTDTPAPASGSAGLYVFNGTTRSTAMDVFVGTGGTFPSSAAVSNLTAAHLSAFVNNVPVGTNVQLRFNNTGTTTNPVLTSSNLTTTAGQTQLAIITDPASGQSAYRLFTVAGC